MARRRIPVKPSPAVTAMQVPAELLDHQSVVWSSPAAFGQWCREHLGRELTFSPLADKGPFHWFCAAAEHWAALNGLDGDRGFTDWAGLAELGIKRPRRRLIIRAAPDGPAS